MKPARLAIGSIAVLCVLSSSLWAAEPAALKPIYNSQKPGEDPSSPEEAARKFTVPAGFQVTLFAGEPDVAQPIAMATDDRGRLWVAECYTYAGRGYDGELRDRIIILHDTDGDGRHDVRKIFWNGGNRLTSLLPALGGCWILNQGALSWLADAEGDDQADGDPEEILNGFDQNQVGHNIVSGLRWGPDGWIYGRHGIQATSLVGLPGAPANKRTAINCSIWRFHPLQKRFEMVTSGTTNPWGLDYNEQGEFFFTNNVIGHAWHVLPGAHFKRMYGADFNPHYYELIDQHADHYHWDNSAKWTDSREGAGVHGELGGGHSHCGGMIYLGANWPDRYRNHLFMCNTHGRRVNQDIPVRSGSGYVIQHGQDMIFANQPWFRGTELVYGPDGGVYLSDWTDLGECHDNDGVHRTSGRVYKITYGQPAFNFQEDLSQSQDIALVEMHRQTNEWLVRQARQVLVDRQRNGRKISEAALAQLNVLASTGEQPTQRLKALWTLYSLGELRDAEMTSLLQESNEHLRVWGVRFLMDGEAVSPAACANLIQLAEQEPSAFVRSYLTSALQKMPAESRWKLAEILCQRAEDAEDHNIPLMLWYGIEPVVADHPEQAAQLMQRTQIPLIRQFLARRLMHENGNDPRIGQLFAAAFEQSDNSIAQRDMLVGMTAATKGLLKANAPPGWDKISDKLLASNDPQVIEMTRELSVVFGDGRAMNELRAIVQDGNAAPIDRINSLGVLISSRPEGTLQLLQAMINDRVLDETAVSGLAFYDDAKTPQLLFNRFSAFNAATRAAAINTLCSRPEYAQALLKAMQDKKVPASELTPAQARQITSLGDAELTSQLEQIWGSLQSTDAQKQARINELKAKLNPEILAQANLASGRKLYDQTCAACHKLFDSGKEIGPTLTGSNRDSLDYLLENMIAPSAVVPRQYQMTTILLDSGRVLNGLIVSQTEQSLLLQTEKEQLTIDQNEVELIKPSQLSLMPEGQLDKLSLEQIRDLVGYLQASHQVEP